MFIESEGPQPGVSVAWVQMMEGLRGGEKEERGGRKLRAEACTDEPRTTVGLRAR